MNRLKREKQVAVLSALLEGCSIRSVERMTGVHRDTVMRLMVRVGMACTAKMDLMMRDLSCDSIEVDEIWSFVGKKQLRLTPEERSNPALGDQYTFYGMDQSTKLIPTFRVGKRDGFTASEFMVDLRSRLNGHVQLTSDGFAAYEDAVELAWGAGEVHYAQLVKMFDAENAGRGRYSPPRVSEVVSTVIRGNPARERVSTSYIERGNLSLRMACRRFTRLTLSYSKKLENLRAALGLWFAWYNLGRIHGSLRVTPAMAAGVSDHVWNLDEIIDLAN